MSNRHLFFSFWILAFLLSLSLPSKGQTDIPEWKKLRYLSEEEMHLEVLSARNFVETEPPIGDIRNVAEFDPMQAVLIRYPFGVPVTVMKAIAEDIELITIVANSSEEQTVINTYQANGVNLDNCTFLQAPTNSWWIRDYGPWFVFDGNNKPGIVDFPYNRPRPRDNDIPAAVAEWLDIDLYGMNILHTGGNYMTDGLGKSSSTDLISEENPSISDEEIRNKLREYLAINNYYILPDPLDDYIKHIDCWGKLLTPGKVIIGQVPSSDYRYADFEEAADFFKNTISSYGVPYEVYRVFTPGQNLVTPYTNSLIVNNKVLVPLTGSIWDDEAIEAYETALPGYEIIGIQHWGWYNTDALHCRSKGVADLGMLYIDHLPILGQKTFVPEIDFITSITAYSGSEIYTDSVFLYFNINNTGFEKQVFSQNPEGNWEISLKDLEPFDVVEYYIEATDHSGRTARHPFIGSADPHELRLSAFVPELLADPDTLFFNTEDELTNGIQASLFNNMFGPITVHEILVPDRPEFTIHLEGVPTLPFDLGANLPLNFTVSFTEPLPDSGTYITDSIIVKTKYFSYPIIFVIDRSGVNNMDIDLWSDVKIYPNPSSGQVNFEYMLKYDQETILEIFAADGKSVFRSHKYQPAGNQILKFEHSDLLNNLPVKGIFHYVMHINGKLFNGTLILE